MYCLWGDERLRALSARAARWVSSASYLKKWTTLGVVIGAAAGVGAIIFYEALVVCTHLFLGVLAGYQVPTRSARVVRWPWPSRPSAGTPPRGGWQRTVSGQYSSSDSLPRPKATVPTRRSLRCITTPGGPIPSRYRQVCGLRAHDRIRRVRWKGGTNGAHQRWFWVVALPGLELGPADGRIAVATGIGPGSAHLRGALGGSVLAAEILYRDDFEPAALLPSFIASVVSYVIFSLVEGFGPLFGYVGTTTSPIPGTWSGSR